MPKECLHGGRTVQNRYQVGGSFLSCNYSNGLGLESVYFGTPSSSLCFASQLVDCT